LILKFKLKGDKSELKTVGSNATYHMRGVMIRDLLNASTSTYILFKGIESITGIPVTIKEGGLKSPQNEE
jgi:hypothetical protein